MKTKNKLFAISVVLLLIGVTSTCSYAQHSDEDSRLYGDINGDVLSFEYMTQFINDIELPETLEFCGEKVPLDRFYVRESLERELLVNSYRHASTLLLLKRTTRWFPVIDPIMRKNHIPEDFKYLAMIESELTNAVSPSKAVGFWQFLEGTAKQYGLEIYKEVDMRYNQELETQIACDFLNDLHNRFGSWTLAAAAFNCGGGRVSRTIEEQHVTSYYDMLLPAETERYIYRILAFKLITQDPAKYGFHISDEGWYQPLEYRTITVTETINDLAQFAINHGTNLKMLKYYNPWLRSNTLTISVGNSYQIKLPK